MSSPRATGLTHSGVIKGISPKDESKVVALKDFIFKQAHASRAQVFVRGQC